MRKKDIFEIIEEMLKKNMEEMHRRMETMDTVRANEFSKDDRIDRKSFSVKITQEPGEEPDIIVQKFGNGSDRMKIEPEENEEWTMKKHPKNVEEFKEPDTSIEEKEGKKIIEVDLPEDIDKNDIEMHKLENSLEIRGYHENTGYYAIFPLEEGYHVVRDKLEDGKYKIYIQTK